MGLMTAAMLADTRLAVSALYPSVIAAFASGSRGYSFTDIAPETGGVMLQGLLREFAPMRRSARDLHHGFSLPSTSVTILDPDGSFKALAETTDVTNTPVTRAIRSRRLTNTDTFTEFVGRLVTWDPIEPNVMLWKLGVNDLPLRGDFPRRKFTRADFPRAGDTGVIGEPRPIILGIHNSQALGDAGAVPGFLTDTLNNRYTFSEGRLYAFRRVYVAGVQVYTGWSAEYQTVNGKRISNVKFTTSQGTAAVTADVEGLDTAGDGSGSVIVNQVAQLKHLLYNHILASHPGFGAWYTSHASVDAALFAIAEAFATQQGWVGSYRSSAAKEGYRVLGDFGTGGLSCFWTNAGKIGCFYSNHRPAASGLYDAAFWQSDRHERAGAAFRHNREWDQRFNRINVDHTYVSGEFKGNLLVQDPLMTEEFAQDDLALITSPAYVV